MSEKQKPVPKIETPKFAEDAPTETAVADPSVIVTHGPYSESLPVVGLTVAQVRRKFGDRLDVHPEATPIISGKPADENTVIGQGDLLMFIRRSGEKGN